MIEIEGKYCTAKVFTNNLNNDVASQIKTLCNQEFTKGRKIRLMPYVNSGEYCGMGFTADLGDKVIPSIVGDDIGCGVLTVELGKVNIDLNKLDNVIRENIPSGVNVHKEIIGMCTDIYNLKVFNKLKDKERIFRELGTLGGGNHFIELDKDDEGNYYLIIHSGSRNLGKQVADIYQKIAINNCRDEDDYLEENKKNEKEDEFEKALLEFKKEHEGLNIKMPKELCYLSGKYREDYINDMNICQSYAEGNRLLMAMVILRHILNMGSVDANYFHTVHNYISFKDNIIRKGSISAYKGEKVLIPMNMRDGSLLCKGKGNSDWNNSAPHGAGRIMNRNQVKKKYSLDEFRRPMEGVGTTEVWNETIQECPMEYKSIDEIIDNIGETVEVVKRLRPVYNFKAK